MRRRFRANHDGVQARLRHHIIDLRGQVQTWESSPHFLQAVGTLIANRNHARIRHFVEDSNVVHSPVATAYDRDPQGRSEEHTSELQSQSNLVCRLLLEKKKLHYNYST